MPNTTIMEYGCIIGYGHQDANASIVSWDSEKHHGVLCQKYEEI